MLAREDFRRRHQRRLPPRFDDLRHGEQGDDRLAGADVALQQPDHPFRAGEVGANFAQRARLRAGELVGQGGLDHCRDAAFADVGAALQRLHPRPHHQQRQLVRQQFVIGEPRRRRPTGIDVARRVRVVHLAQRLQESGRAEPALGRFVHPFGQSRRARQGALRGPGERAGIKPLGQAVDRLDGRHARQLFGRHHLVGMDHLQIAVPDLQLAGDPARRAQRQAVAHPFFVVAEKHQFDVAGVVLDQDFERCLGARAGRRAMLDDAHFQSRDRAALRVADFRPRAAVERRVGQMEENVDDPRAAMPIKQAVEQLGVFWADAGQCAGGREKGIEQGGSHGRFIRRTRRRASATLKSAPGRRAGSIATAK